MQRQLKVKNSSLTFMLIGKLRKKEDKMTKSDLWKMESTKRVLLLQLEL